MIYVSEDESAALVTHELAFEAVRQALVAAASGQSGVFPAVLGHSKDPTNRFSIKSGWSAELTGVKVPDTVQGKSLVPVLRGKAAEVHDAVYGYFTDTQRMVRTADGWKLIWYPKAGRTQLFNVSDDPAELRDLSAEAGQKERVRKMTQSLKSWLRDRGDALGKE